MIETKRDNVVDVIKVVALLFVIVIHNSFCDIEILKYGFPFYLKCAVPTFIILSSYVLSDSFKKRNIDSLKKAYNINYLIARYIRFIVPYLFIVIIQIIFRYFYMHNEFGIRETIYSIISGGYGKGGYYNVIMFQLIILFPLIYFLVKRKGIYGVIDCFLINLLYEIIQTSYLMNGSFYRLISLRYIFIISIGVFIYLSKKKIRPYILLISFVIGLLYVVLVDYTSYKPLFITKWSDTSLFFGFYVIPVIYVLLNMKRKKLNLKIMNSISKASYNIFLVQTLLYYIIDNLKIKITDSIVINCLIMVVASFIVGYIFYKIEAPITKWLISITNKISFKKNNKIESILLNG